MTEMALDLNLTGLSSPFSSSGTYPVKDAIYKKWKELAGAKTGTGDNVQGYLGYPLGEETPVAAGQGGGTAQTFERGMIVAAVDGAGFVVYGMIYLRYAALGGLGSFLSRPTSGEEAAAAYPSSRAATFTGAAVPAPTRSMARYASAISPWAVRAARSATRPPARRP